MVLWCQASLLPVACILLRPLVITYFHTYSSHPVHFILASCRSCLPRYYATSH
ncbi:hypothetical protein BDV12DRAFT_166969 [Aspergillus spectabilis]